MAASTQRMYQADALRSPERFGPRAIVPLFRTQALGADSGLSVLVTPQIILPYDTYDTTFVPPGPSGPPWSVRLIGDLFNVNECQTPCCANNNILSTAFNTIDKT